MTDAQITEALGKIIGWKQVLVRIRKGGTQEYDDCESWQDADGKEVRLGPFNPLHDYNDMALVEDKMVASGWKPTYFYLLPNKQYWRFTKVISPEQICEKCGEISRFEDTVTAAKTTDNRLMAEALTILEAVGVSERKEAPNE